MGSLAPYTIGYVATLPYVGIGSALALTSAFSLAGAVRYTVAMPASAKLALHAVTVGQRGCQTVWWEVTASIWFDADTVTTKVLVLRVHGATQSLI